MDLFFANIAYASVDEFIGNVNRLILNPLIGFMFALAFVLFLYGVVEFMMNLEAEEKRTVGKKHIAWGLIGMTIMFGVWTVLDIVLNTFGIEGINPKEGTVELNDYNPTYPPN